MSRPKRPINGRISVHTFDVVGELLDDNDRHEIAKDHHRRAVSASSIERTKSLGEHSEVRAASAKSACPSDHTFRIQSWLNEKSVRNIQERTDFESRATKNMYTTLLDNENTFVKDVDSFIDHKAALDKRKKQMLFKKWSERVYSPVKEKIDQEMNGPNYRHLDRRKRDIYKKYLDYNNRKGVVFLDVMSPEEYDPLVLNANRPAPLKAITKTLDDPLISQGCTRLDEDRTVVRCITGDTMSDKEIDDMHLPPAPLVPLGRHGTECNTWLRMQLHDIDSGVRKRSGQRMKGIYNDSQLDYEEWRKLERNSDTIDIELRSQKRRLFREKHSTTLQFDWPELPTIKQNTAYHPRIPNVLPFGTSFEYYPELQLSASY
ncbi:hypothetical protein OS493_013702 [Desmophyllum pertusum]|uniref:Protein FAM228B n=1 Tax=Desmophyllum pertusum TaxID=174260 RepID=A0A9W9ZQR0_9CNID|nr:hypothetical protein OS493_013702 [Desmophyllum pertusum]